MRRRILTLPVPLGGLIAGNLSKNASYGAVHKDDLPSVHFGRIIRVPVAPLEEKLGLEPGAIEEMIFADPALAAMAGVVINTTDSDGSRGLARGKQPTRSGDRRRHRHADDHHDNRRVAAADAGGQHDDRSDDDVGGQHDDPVLDAGRRVAGRHQPRRSFCSEEILAAG